MSKCRKCNKEIEDGDIIGCKICGNVFCSQCANSTLKICPSCYNDMEYIG